jgi:hypothetical protein
MGIGDIKFGCFSVTGSDVPRQFEFTFIVVNGIVNVHMLSKPDGHHTTMALTPFDAEFIGKTLQEFAATAESEVIDLTKLQPSSSKRRA